MRNDGSIYQINDRKKEDMHATRTIVIQKPNAALAISVKLWETDTFNQQKP
jgi:hypothetical protein